MKTVNKLLTNLNNLYEIQPFSLGLHTTDEMAAQSICKQGLKTGVRAIEGTVKFRGDMQQVTDRDLDYFFPYTTHTVVVVIPKEFDAPRIDDNQGGDMCLCEFSKFFKKASRVHDDYKDGYQGLLPSYYILGFYDKDFNFTVNNNCMLFNDDSKEKYLKDVEDVKSAHELIFSLD